MEFEELKSCAELTNAHAEQAVSSGEAFRAFFAWAARVARPGEGAPKVLMAISRLLRAEWIEGWPRSEIRGDDTATTVSVVADMGMGIREKVVPDLLLPVPFEEFVRAVKLAPQLLGPMRVRHEEDALFLSPIPAADESAPGSAEAIRIDDRSLLAQERPTVTSLALADRGPPSAPPTLRDANALHTHPTPRELGAVRPEVLRPQPNEDLDEDD